MHADIYTKDEAGTPAAPRHNKRSPSPLPPLHAAEPHTCCASLLTPRGSGRAQSLLGLVNGQCIWAVCPSGHVDVCVPIPLRSLQGFTRQARACVVVFLPPRSHQHRRVGRLRTAPTAGEDHRADGWQPLGGQILVHQLVCRRDGPAHRGRDGDVWFHVRVRQLRRQFWKIAPSHISQLYATPHAPCDMLYLLPVRIGCRLVLAIRWHARFLSAGRRGSGGRP